MNSHRGFAEYGSNPGHPDVPNPGFIRGTERKLEVEHSGRRILKMQQV
jgi:hypothetical protein